jgi:hypothetical protein
MNADGFRVIIRARNTFISAGLELESQRAFAVIYVYGPNATQEVVGRERMEIDVRFLQQITESEYLYKQLIELPEPGRSGNDAADMGCLPCEHWNQVRHRNTARCPDSVGEMVGAVGRSRKGVQFDALDGKQSV